MAVFEDIPVYIDIFVVLIRGLRSKIVIRFERVTFAALPAAFLPGRSLDTKRSRLSFELTLEHTLLIQFHYIIKLTSSTSVGDFTVQFYKGVASEPFRPTSSFATRQAFLSADNRVSQIPWLASLPVFKKLQKLLS